MTISSNAFPVIWIWIWIWICAWAGGSFVCHCSHIVLRFLLNYQTLVFKPYVNTAFNICQSLFNRSSRNIHRTVSHYIFVHMLRKWKTWCLAVPYQPVSQNRVEWSKETNERMNEWTKKAYSAQSMHSNRMSNSGTAWDICDQCVAIDSSLLPRPLSRHIITIVIIAVIISNWICGIWHTLWG